MAIATVARTMIAIGMATVTGVVIAAGAMIATATMIAVGIVVIGAAPIMAGAARAAGPNGAGITACASAAKGHDSISGRLLPRPPVLAKAAINRCAARIFRGARV